MDEKIQRLLCEFTHEDLNDKFSKVLRTDGIVYATDRHKVMLVKTDQDCNIEEQKLPAITDMWNKNNMNSVVTLSKLERVISSLPLVEDRIICPDCQGYGKVEYEYVDSFGTTHEHTMDCPVCGGGERFEATELCTIPNPCGDGRKVPNRYVHIEIFDALIRAEYIMLLRDAMKALGINEAVMVNRDAQICMFSLAENIRVGFCPMNPHIFTGSAKIYYYE